MGDLYLSQESIKAATQRLGKKKGRGYVEFIISKRTFVLTNSNAFSPGRGCPEFVMANIETALVNLEQVSVPLNPDGTDPEGTFRITGWPLPIDSDKVWNQGKYFMPFGYENAGSKAGLRTHKYPSNGVGDTVQRWQNQEGTPPLNVTRVDGERRIVPTSPPPSKDQLRAFFKVDPNDLPSLSDAAIWWHRYRNIEGSDGGTPSLAELCTTFVQDVGLSALEKDALFTEMESEPAQPNETWAATDAALGDNDSGGTA